MNTDTRIFINFFLTKKEKHNYQTGGCGSKKKILFSMEM